MRFDGFDFRRESKIKTFDSADLLYQKSHLPIDYHK
jgi:hypothetical protein